MVAAKVMRNMVARLKQVIMSIASSRMARYTASARASLRLVSGGVWEYKHHHYHHQHHHQQQQQRQLTSIHSH